jgi:hypothetical protein
MTEVRPITSRAGGFLPRTHGCALFTRGETQALAVTTLGEAPALCWVRHAHWVPSGCREQQTAASWSRKTYIIYIYRHLQVQFIRCSIYFLCAGSVSSAQKLDAVTEEDELQHFYLQYFFPPSSVGEVRLCQTVRRQQSRRTPSRPATRAAGAQSRAAPEQRLACDSSS